MKKSTPKKNTSAKNIFALVDVETTGSSPVRDRIIEIGIVRVEDGNIVKRFQTLLYPGRSLPISITLVTGIQNEELIQAPHFEDIQDKIYDLLKGAVFVAHNARFDYAFVKNEFKRFGIQFTAKCLCTVRLSKKLFPSFPHHDLSSLIERYNLSCPNRHRAFDDAYVIWQFLEKVKKLKGKELLDQAISELLSRHTLPQHLHVDIVKDLPEKPGVYIFYGKDNEVLYVGKSKCIRDRVLSHFSNDHITSKEMHMCQDTIRIETHVTAGELGALLLESRLVKELCPTYNRLLRRKKQLVVARKQTTSLGYSSLHLEHIESFDEEVENVLAVYRSKIQAKNSLKLLADEYNLCPKLLELEKSAHSCFYFQLQKCNGACMHIEDVNVYNERFNEAFKQRSIKAWPFSGPIMIEERTEEHKKQIFILDKWCLITEITQEGDDMEQVTHAPEFDYDSYKIFSRYILNPVNKYNIKQLKKHDARKILQYNNDVVSTIY